MEHVRIVQLLRRAPVGERVVVRGWVRTRRDSKGGFSFIELNDGSCLANLQIVADGKLANYQSEILRVSPGASLRVDGTVQQSQGKGQAIELHAESIDVIGFSEADYPLQKKQHGFEFLR